MKTHYGNFFHLRETDTDYQISIWLSYAKRSLVVKCKKENRKVLNLKGYNVIVRVEESEKFPQWDRLIDIIIAPNANIAQGWTKKIKIQ